MSKNSYCGDEGGMPISKVTAGEPVHIVPSNDPKPATFGAGGTGVPAEKSKGPNQAGGAGPSWWKRDSEVKYHKF